MPVRAGGDHAQRDTVPVDQDGAFRALFAAIDRGTARGFVAARGFDDAPVDDQVRKVQAS